MRMCTKTIHGDEKAVSNTERDVWTYVDWEKTQQNKRKKTRVSFQPPVGGSVSAAGVGRFRVGGWSESKHTLGCLTSATSFRLTHCFLSGLVLSAVHPETLPWSLKRKNPTLFWNLLDFVHILKLGGGAVYLSKVLTWSWKHAASAASAASEKRAGKFGCTFGQMPHFIFSTSCTRVPNTQNVLHGYCIALGFFVVGFAK